MENKKIRVELQSSENKDFQNFTLEELGVTESEWSLLSKEKQRTKVEHTVFNMQDQPFWVLYSFTQIQ